MRSKNDGALIGATLRAVHTQDFPGAIELIHIDSGSTDDTVDIIKSFKPAKLIQIKPEDYVPGAVLNSGMRAATSPWVVFLNSDAEPADAHWLSEMLSAAKNTPRGGAVFGRQIPRPGCQAVYAHDYERCFGRKRETNKWEHFFSMASSAVNREAWEQNPFREDLQYSEDDEWSRRLVQKGFVVAYAEKSIAIHSHNYTLDQAFRRSYGEAFALAAVEGKQAAHYTFPKTVIAGAVREALRDFGYCLRTRSFLQWPHALGVRLAQRLGKLRGYRDGWMRYQTPRGSAS